MKREVKEEAGVDFEPQALIGVETQGMSWVRVTFSGMSIMYYYTFLTLSPIMSTNAVYCSHLLWYTRH